MGLILYQNFDALVIWLFDIIGDFITDANDACNITMAIVPSPTILSNQTTKVFSGIEP